MNLKVGDHLVVVDENLHGTLVRTDGKSIVLECEDGFEYRYEIHQVYKKATDGKIEHIPSNYNLITDIDDTMGVNHFVINLDWTDSIFDLHIETMAASIEFKNDSEILSFQLDYVREIIRQAKIKRIRSLVLVHGVGKGILRKEIRNMIDGSFPKIEYFDGSYQKFGAGATEIIIHQFKEED